MWDGRIYLTSNEGDDLVVLAVDAADGHRAGGLPGGDRSAAGGRSPSRESPGCGAADRSRRGRDDRDDRDDRYPLVCWLSRS